MDRLTRSVRVTLPQLWMSQPRTNRVVRRRIIGLDDLEHSDQSGSRRTMHTAEYCTSKLSRHDRGKHPNKRGPKRAPHLESSWLLWRRWLRKVPPPSLLVGAFGLDEFLRTQGCESTEPKCASEPNLVGRVSAMVSTPNGIELSGASAGERPLQ
jgi:hypothetical protein